MAGILTNTTVLLKHYMVRIGHIFPNPVVLGSERPDLRQLLGPCPKATNHKSFWLQFLFAWKAFAPQFLFRKVQYDKDEIAVIVLLKPEAVLQHLKEKKAPIMFAWKFKKKDTFCSSCPVWNLTLVALLSLTMLEEWAVWRVDSHL